MSGPSNEYFHVFQKNPFTFPFESVQRCMMKFRMDGVKLYSNVFKSMSDVHKINLQCLCLPMPLFHLISSTNGLYLYKHSSLNPYCFTGKCFIFEQLSVSEVFKM